MTGRGRRSTMATRSIVGEVAWKTRSNSAEWPAEATRRWSTTQRRVRSVSGLTGPPGGRGCVRFRRPAVRGAGAGSGGGHAQGGRSRGAGVRAAGVRRRDGLGRGPAPDQRRHHRPGGSTGVRHVERAGGAGQAQQPRPTCASTSSTSRASPGVRARTGRTAPPRRRSSGGATRCWPSRSTTAPTASRSTIEFPLSDSVVTAIETQDVRPRLTANDWAGAAIALADGLRTGHAAGGSGERRGGPGRCPSGSSSAGSRWSAAGPTCWPAAGAGHPRKRPRRPRRHPRRSPTRPPARRPTTSPITPAARSSTSTTPCRPPSTSSASPAPSSATRRSRTSNPRWSSRGPSWCRRSRCASGSTTSSPTNPPGGASSARSCTCAAPRTSASTPSRPPSTACATSSRTCPRCSPA